MSTEIDHIFVCCSKDGAEADRLAEHGLNEGAPNTHPGQGTACRRFFFANCYLELLWICDASEAQSDSIAPTRLWERWSRRSREACPFGFAFRPADPLESEPPFPNWEYRPPYLPAPLSIHVAGNSNAITEPMLFFLPFAQRPDESLRNSNLRTVGQDREAGPGPTSPERTHQLGQVTRVVLTVPHTSELSAELKAVLLPGLLQLAMGSEYLLEIGFDNQLRDHTMDFRPLLPLVIHS